MNKNYSFCGKRFCINSPLPLTEHENLDLFSVEEGNTDISVTYKIVDKLPVTPPGKVAKNGVTVSRDGDTVYHNNPMGVAEGALSCYNLKDPSQAQVFFTKDSFSVMADFRYMWNSVSLGQLLLPFKALLFHASYISVDGEAILFSASCGVGKSTQADLWRKYKGAEIINGDKAGVSVEADGVYAHGLPFSGTSGICKNKTMPLKAIVLLGQSPENTIRRVTGVEAIQNLLNNIYLDFLAPGEMQRCVDVLIELLETVPVYRLDCTPDERAVETLALELGMSQ